MTLFPKQRSIQSFRMLRCFNMVSLGQYHCPVAVRLGTLERQTRPFFQREIRFNEVALNCRVFPQILSLRVVIYFIITEEINVLVFRHVYSSFNCLMPYVVAKTCDIHAERIVLDNLYNAHHHIVVGGENNIDVIRMHLYYGFYGDYCFFGQIIAALHSTLLALTSDIILLKSLVSIALARVLA